MKGNTFLGNNNLCHYHPRNQAVCLRMEGSVCVGGGGRGGGLLLNSIKKIHVLREYKNMQVFGHLKIKGTGNHLCTGSSAFFYLLN